MRGIWTWISRAIGIILCATAWLVAMGLYSLGTDWFVDNVGLHSLEDLLIHGIVRVLGQTGGALFFFGGGIFLLWAFWRRDPA